MVIDKARTDKKLSRRKRSLLDNSRLRQKLLRKYYSSLIPSLGGPNVKSSTNPKPPLGNGKNPDDYQYNEDDYWMTYLITQHKLSNNHLNDEQYVEETKKFLRMKAFYDDVEKEVVNTVRKKCLIGVEGRLQMRGFMGRFREKELNDNKKNKLFEDIVDDINQKDWKQLEEYKIEKQNFVKFLSYVRKNPKRTADAFVKLLLFSNERLMEHNWLTYYGSNIDRLFETDETDIQSALTLTSVATMFYRPNSFGHDMRHLIKELQQTRNHVHHAAAECKHTEELNELKGAIENRNGSTKNNLTPKYYSYLKNILEMDHPENCLNPGMSGLQFNLPTGVNQHRHNAKSYKPNKKINDFLLGHMKKDFILLQNYTSGFSQAFKRDPGTETLEKRSQARRFKISFVIEIFWKTLIGKGKDRKFWHRWVYDAVGLRARQQNYRNRCGNRDKPNKSSLLKCLTELRNAAVKGTESLYNLDTKVQEACNLLLYFEDRLDHVPRDESLNEETKRECKNFAKCIRKALQSDDVRFNYHLLTISFGHNRFNEYLSNLMQDGKMSRQDKIRAFFELGLYSGFAKISAEANANRQEEMRRPAGLVFKQKLFMDNYYIDNKPRQKLGRHSRHIGNQPRPIYPPGPIYPPPPIYPPRPLEQFIILEPCNQPFLNFPGHFIQFGQPPILPHQLNRPNFRGGAPHGSFGPLERQHSGDEDEIPSEPSCLEESTGVVRRKSLKRKLSRDADQAKKVKKLRMKICEFEEKLERLNQLMNECQEQ